MDATVNLSKTHFMRSALLILLFCLSSPVLIAQDAESIVFNYRCVPTSTSDYLIEITKSKFRLHTTNKIPDKNNRIKKVDTSNYTHDFDSKERAIVDSIIKVNKLDSPGLYKNRIIDWGSLWEVNIRQNSKTQHIDLPNYNNPGLESLIHFIVCLIPKKERPFFMCKECE